MVKKRIIFTLTTGRSGTALLTKLLEPLPQVHAEHEPKPLFSDAFVYLKSRSNFNISEFCHMKLKAIYELMGDKDIYIETCHMFGKGFLEPMLELCHDLEIIILHRNPVDVAMSMYRLGDIPGRTKTGIHWYLSPDDDLSLTTLISTTESNTTNFSKYTDFQLCYWYTQEMLCRMNHALYHHKQNISHTIEFRELLSYTYFENILHKLELEIPRDYPLYYKSVIFTKINEKLYRKHPLPKPDDWQEQIAQIHKDFIVK